MNVQSQPFTKFHCWLSPLIVQNSLMVDVHSSNPLTTSIEFINCLSWSMTCIYCPHHQWSLYIHLLHLSCLNSMIFWHRVGTEINFIMINEKNSFLYLYIFFWPKTNLAQVKNGGFKEDATRTKLHPDWRNGEMTTSDHTLTSKNAQVIWKLYD